MKRAVIATILVAAAAVAAPSVLADVKTKQKTLFRLEGVLGTASRMFGGGAMRDGITSTVAVKGNRKSSISDVSGTIVDLTEQKMYMLDVKKKEYTVRTFAEMRAEFEKARADAEKQKAQMKPEDKQDAEQASRQLEFSAKVEDTGEKQTIAGYDTHKVILTVIGHEKGKTLEESGGLVMTSEMWMGPKIAALDELRDFELRFFKAVYGESFAADMTQMAQLSALYPSFKPMMDQLQTEGRKLNGTALSTTTTFEGVKSPEQQKQSQQNQSSGGGGLGGMLARRMANRGNQQQGARTKILTTTTDMLSVETSATAADVAMPAGYKEKK